MNKYSQRLLDEWILHRRIVLAVDYDSTIRPWKTIDNQEDIDRCIALVKEVQSTRAYITIHTACSPDRYHEIITYCKSHGIKVDSINVNPTVLPFGKNEIHDESKIFYNHQLCDRSGLIESMNLLEEALYAYRGYLQKDRIKEEQAE